jgi:diguanylate cyclase (GGDEF)-like protein
MTSEHGPADARATIDVAAALVSSLKLEEALTTAVERIGHALDVSFVTLWRCSARDHRATFEAYWSHDGYTPHDSEHVGMVVGLDARPGFVPLIEQRVVAEYHSDDPALTRQMRVFMDQRNMRTMLEAPLIVADEVMGVLTLGEIRSVRHFSAAERELLDELCMLAAIGIRNADLYRRREEQERRLLSLLESSRATAVSLGAQHAVETMKLEIARMLPGIDFDLDLHIDLGGGALERFVAEQPDGELTMEARQGPPDELAKRALDEQKPVQERTGDRMRLVVPLELSRGFSGYVDLRGPMAREFDEDEVSFMQTLAHHAATAFEQARLQRHIANRSVIDPKTGLYTAAFFHDRLFSELVRADRYQESVSLILMTIDDIKEYRDESGRPAGDAVMRALGRFLKRHLRRRIDLACRSGDNQFAIALPNTALADGSAAKEAEHLRAMIRSWTFCDEDERSLGQVTVSQGVACYPDHAHDAMALMTAAENALRLARQSGRDRVEISQEIAQKLTE